MQDSQEFKKRVLDHWNQRAVLADKAGSEDVIAKQLEVEAIAAHVADGMRVLELGCGNGLTALEIATRFEVAIVALDFADKMVEHARLAARDRKLRGKVEFDVGDVTNLSAIKGSFDLIYTERVLINLPDYSTQAQAIADITRLLVDGGCYVMCENSHDGLDRINALREQVGLIKISPPWHNRYFRDAELEQLDIPGIRLERIEEYSSTYYLLSRVVNAWVAQREGKEPRYNSPINEIALHLPPIGNFAQGRIWLWRKTC
jgi:ubiquinone/menaquinone biosynthesis C-methylase UbiE